MPTFTVGTGGDFPTFQAAFASFALGLSASHELVQISDVTETAASNLAFRWNGFTITIRTSQPHYGVWANAYKIRANFNSLGILGLFDMFGLNPATPSDILRLTINGLAFYAQHANFNTAFIYYPVGGTVTRYLTMFNCLFDLNGRVGCTALDTAAGPFASAKYINAYNCMAFNAASTVYAFTNRGIGGTFENMTYWGAAGRGFRVDGNNVEVFNCISLGVEGGQFSWNTGVGGDAISRNNASSDATSDDAVTQTDNLINQAAATHFASTDLNSSDFLMLKSDSTLRQAGRAPTIAGNILGIRENLRPGYDGFSSMGADEEGVVIRRTAIFPSSTGKLSHARIIRGHRSPEQAQAFHEVMRGAT